MILHNIACRKYGFALQPPVCVLRERRKGLTAICAAPCTRLIRSRSFNLHITTGNFMTEYSSKKHETGGMKKNIVWHCICTKNRLVGFRTGLS